MNNIDRTIQILKKVLETDDMEIKNCALQSLIDMLEEEKITTKKERLEKRK